MKISIRHASLAALTLLLVTGQANAARLCKLTGSYSDDYGSTTSITGKKGSILNTLICATAYTFKISGETQTGFNVAGKNKTKSCGTFSASLTFEGSCDVFGGTVTINGEPLSDTFTKEGAPAHRQKAVPTNLTKGLQ
jgi:hypothetical protein